MKKETKHIIQSASEFLKTQSEDFKTKVMGVLDFMRNDGMEIKANSIYFWRNPDSKNLRLEIAILENDEYETYDCKLNQRLIQDWDSVFSPKQIYRFYEKNGEKESIELELQIEFLFMNWFIDNWYQIDGHKLKNCNQVIIENSTAIGFDLNSMNYQYAIYGEEETQYKYSFKLSKQEIDKRLKVFGFEKRYINSIKRTLTNNQNIIDLEISESNLTYKNLPKEYISEIQEANSTNQDFEMLRTMTKIIDKLIELNYREI
jgi:hypothetical protein